MKRKLLSTVVALSMTASMTMPVFAASQNKQTSEVPVIGKVGRWNSGTTLPDGSGGGNGENNEVTTPGNITDINVTIPTSMTFNVVTNTTDSDPDFVTAEYKVTNNGEKAVNMSGQYDVKNAGDIDLVDQVTVNTTDSKVQLALSLNSGNTGAVNTPFIDHVKNGSKSSNNVNIGNGQSTYLKFNSDDAGMADAKAEAKVGKLQNTKTTTGNLVLTFEQQ